LTCEYNFSKLFLVYFKKNSNKKIFKKEAEKRKKELVEMRKINPERLNKLIDF